VLWLLVTLLLILDDVTQRNLRLLSLLFEVLVFDALLEVERLNISYGLLWCCIDGYVQQMRSKRLINKIIIFYSVHDY
jgi:hypothetical protein